MPIVLTVLQIVAPVFDLGGIGVIWVRGGWEFRVAFVTRLAMTLAVPALIFTALVELEVEPAELGALALATCAAYAAVAVVAWAVLRLAGLSMQTFLAPVIFGNTGNLGLPLALFAFGEAGLGYAVVIFAIMAIMSFTFGLWIVAGGRGLGAILREPLVGATLLGGLFLIAGITPPEWVMNTLGLLGQMAIPLMLITLGVAVGRLAPRGLGRALALSAFKILLTVSAGAGAAMAFALAPVPAAVLTLQVATPVAVTSYLLAEKYGAEAADVAGLVVVSTALSVLALPVLLGFLL